MKKNVLKLLFYAALINTCITQDGNAQANTSLSNLAGTTAINSHLLPDTNDTKDLGSSALGWRSLYLNQSIYMRAQRFLAGDVDHNTFLGINAGTSVAGGMYNTAIGYNALISTLSGNYSTAIGAYSLSSNLYGENNLAIGYFSLGSNINGMDNIGIGSQAGSSNTNGNGNTAVGHYSLLNNTAENITAVGLSSLGSNTTGASNSALGYQSLVANTTGSGNSAFGYSALQSNTTGIDNTAVGASSLYSNLGAYNTAIGSNSLIGTTSGSNIVAVGYYAGYSAWTGWGNTFVGNYAALEPTNASNSTALGFEAYATASNQVRLGNSYVTSIGGYTNWTNLSDGRFKKNMKENVPGLEFITKLRPVTYTLDMDGLDAALKSPLPVMSKNSSGKGIQTPGQPERKISSEEKASREQKAQIVQTGFVAQEVEKAAQELGYNFSGVDAPKNSKDFYGLRYAEFVVPLVKAVQELNEQNAALEERVRRLEELITKNMQGNNTSITLSGARLEQNAPNPFNGSTIIRYMIPENEGPGRIVITDMKGSTIKAVNVNGKSNGQITLSKGTLSAGEYIYSLWIGERVVDSKRMIVK